jgi:hypothetical protein
VADVAFVSCAVGHHPALVCEAEIIPNIFILNSENGIPIKHRDF